MKRRCTLVLATLVALSATGAPAAILVNDTWRDATRTDPAAPTYSEMGVDADADLDLESAWFSGGAVTMTTTAGNLSQDLTGSSANFTTYFTPEGSEVNLANHGDKLRVTWTFSLTGVVAQNDGQNFRIALVDSLSGNRLTADGSPVGGGAGNPYTGYALFANMGTTLGSTVNAFQIRQRVGNAGTNAIVGTAADWATTGLTGTTNGTTAGNDGYDNGTPYTLVWELTRNGAGIDILATMSGAGFNGSGTGTITANDADGNGFKFDTFNVRPASEATTASVFDTSLFRVEFLPVPEPGAALLVALAAVGGLAVRRRG